MTNADLTRLLTDAAAGAERQARPPADPLRALAQVRRRREQRRGHVAALALVVFVVLLQAVPTDAFGAARPGTPSVGAIAAWSRG